MKNQVVLLLISFLASIGAQAGLSQVNVYTERQPVFLEDIFELFSNSTGIEVEVLYLDSGLADRVAEEGEDSPADVVILTDVGRLTDFANRGLAQELNLAAAVVPVWLRDDQDRWIALTRRIRMAYVAKGAGAEPRSYEDLADPRWRGQVCLRSLTHPYNVALVAAYLGYHGEPATLAWLQGLAANLARSPQGNDRAQIIGVANGVCGVGIANDYYFHKMMTGSAKDQQAAADKVKLLPISLGNDGPHTNIAGVAIARHAKHVSEARQLIEYLLSQQVQDMMVSRNGEQQVRGYQGEANGHAKRVSLSQIGLLRARASQIIERAGLSE